MLRSIKDMAHAVREYERQRATARLVGSLDKHVLRDVGLEDWRARL